MDGTIIRSHHVSQPGSGPGKGCELRRSSSVMSATASKQILLCYPTPNLRFNLPAGVPFELPQGEPEERKSGGLFGEPTIRGGGDESFFFTPAEHDREDHSCCSHHRSFCHARRGHRPIRIFREVHAQPRYHRIVRRSVPRRGPRYGDHQPLRGRHRLVGQRRRRRPQLRHGDRQQHPQGHRRLRFRIRSRWQLQHRLLHPRLGLLRLRPRTGLLRAHRAHRRGPRLGGEPDRAPRRLPVVAVPHRRNPRRFSGNQLG